MTSQTPRYEYPRVLSIAGSDSGGGAGIQADLKTIAALGCFGMTAITALTAQNTCGVRAIHGVPPQMLRDQIDAVIEDIGAHAVKIGMLHAPEIVQTVAEAIDRHALPNVVFDPVMVATSGAVLIEQASMDVLVRELFPRAALITPNLDEAGLLVGKPLASTDDMEGAALALRAQGARAVLLKGGHLLPQYADAWARYYTRFIAAYEAEGIPIWGISVQNEPMAIQKWESMQFSAEEERDFLKNHLGPTCMLVLLAAPKANDYYPKLGFEHNPRAWMLRKP